FEVRQFFDVVEGLENAVARVAQNAFKRAGGLRLALDQRDAHIEQPLELGRRRVEHRQHTAHVEPADHHRHARGAQFERQIRRARKLVALNARESHQHLRIGSPVFPRDLLREGKIGPVTFIKTGRYFNAPPERPVWRWYGYYNQYEHPDPNQVIKELDWEKWLGATPKIDFNERHFWHWRCYWAYGTGQAGDLLSHELDYVQAVTRWGIPDTCMCAGLNAFWKDDREVPDTWLATYQFEQNDCSLTFEGVQNSGREQTPEFCGRNGRLIYNGIGQDANRFEVYDDTAAWRMDAKPPEPTYRFDPRDAPKWPNHMENFLECVRTRELPRCNVDEAFIETATLLMSVQSYHQKRQVRWDREREEIV
ncbi:MAG: Inositol 2-dehydrogenase, partial [Candidatus Hydrogenedentes bacterium]|nr:Inositol 2-dehydrogenase [Candidatus Hydrogenedentota bacterium]